MCVFAHCFSHTFSLSLEANNASFQATRRAEFHNLPSRYISSLLLAPAILLSYKLPMYGLHELYELQWLTTREGEKMSPKAKTNNLCNVNYKLCIILWEH